MRYRVVWWMITEILEKRAAVANYSSVRKLEAICSSETTVSVYRTTRCYVEEDRHLDIHRPDNLKTHIYMH
jgi:hypothetical protein